jgi:hypothetical protein
MAYRHKWSSVQKIAIVLKSSNTNISVANSAGNKLAPRAYYDRKEKVIDSRKLAPAVSFKTTPISGW